MIQFGPGKQESEAAGREHGGHLAKTRGQVGLLPSGNDGYTSLLKMAQSIYSGFSH